MQQGTILITLNEGSQSGSQPAHMELAAIIIGLAIRRWKLPPQQGDTIYSDCKSLTDVLTSSASPLSKHPAKPTFLQAVLQHFQAPAPRGSPLTGPNLIQNDDSRRRNTRSTSGEYYSPTALHPTIPSQVKFGSNSTSSSPSQCYSKPPSIQAPSLSASPLAHHEYHPQSFSKET